MSEQEDIERWKEAVIRGKRTEQFVASSFWKLYMEPDLKAKIDFKSPEGLPAGALWKPGVGSKGMESTAMGSAYHGGKFDQIVDFFTMINTWIRQGREAEQNLTKRDISI